MKSIIFTTLTTCLIVSYLFLFSSCQKETVINDSIIPLRFSVDTLRFDTVFTETGSATRLFKIYNDQDGVVLLDKISLDDPTGFFRINVDGINEDVVENVRIEPQDSLYVFAEVTIDPDMPLSISPFIIENYVRIQANDSNYEVLLQAFGQNANYVPSRNSKSELNLISCDFGTWTWDDPRPYVIYGALFIDSCELIIPEGQQVYVHGGVAINDIGIYNDGLLIFLENGSLVTQGTAENPVIFKTDRLEESFDELQGQWSGILFTPGSKGNNLTHTIVENSGVGISIDSSAEVRLESCTFAHTSGSGLVASNAIVYAENCLFYDNGSFGLSLNFGGLYNFNYCTIANYDNQDQAMFLNNFKCYNDDCSEFKVSRTQARFRNCLFVGNDEDEIGLSDASDTNDPNFFDYQFENSIVIVNDLLDANAFPNFFDRCVNCENIDRTDTLFLDPDMFDYSLDTMSFAIDLGKSINNIDTDILNNPREVDQPDIGCYEFQK